ncbi:MAG: hypothetical protein HYS70_01240 [Nitrospinae bacterium]|nr:hypothetical protein [Nitrospinota bacterium]
MDPGSSPGQALGQEGLEKPSAFPERWSAMADRSPHHNAVQEQDEVLFLFACELIQDPGRGRFPGDLPRTLNQVQGRLWSHYSPFWREGLPQEAFEELERSIRRRLEEGPVASLHCKLEIGKWKVQI